MLNICFVLHESSLISSYVSRFLPPSVQWRLLEYASCERNYVRFPIFSLKHSFRFSWTQYGSSRAFNHCAAHSPENGLFYTFHWSEALPGFDCSNLKIIFVKNLNFCFTALFYCLARSPEGMFFNMLCFEKWCLNPWFYYHKRLLLS